MIPHLHRRSFPLCLAVVLANGLARMTSPADPLAGGKPSHSPGNREEGTPRDAAIWQAPPNPFQPDQEQIIRFTAQVVDAETGQPLERFRLNRGAVRDDQPDEAVVWDGDESLWTTDGGPAVEEFKPELWMALRFQYVASAASYLPALSPWYVQASTNHFTFRLQRGPGITGRVVGPDGQTVKGAVVALKQYGYLVLSGGSLGSGSPRGLTRSDEEGRFALPSLIPEPRLVAAHPDQGYGEISGQALAGEIPLQLQGWASVAGEVPTDLLPSDPSRATVMIDLPLGEDPRYLLLATDSYRVPVNADGHFLLTHVPPRRMQLRLTEEGPPGRTRLANFVNVQPKPGETTRVQWPRSDGSP